MDLVLTHTSRRSLAGVLVSVLALLATLLVGVQTADAAHAITVAPADGGGSECESDGTTDNAISFTVSLENQFGAPTSADPDDPVVVHFDTIEGTSEGVDPATMGDDFTQTSGTVTISFPADSGTAEVPVNCDGVVENDERFRVVFYLDDKHDGGNVELDNGEAEQFVYGTITDGPQPPDLAEFSFVDSHVDVDEGDSGSTSVTLQVELDDIDSCTDLTCTVDWETVDGDATGGDDYTSDSGTLRWNALGDNLQSLTVSVSGDSGAEPNETFTVVLSNPQHPDGAAIGSGTATVTIVNDDSSRVSVLSASSSEGDASHDVQFVIDKPVGTDINVVWHTVEGSAEDGVDYDGQASSTSTKIAANAQGASVALTIHQDEIVERWEENFYVVLECIRTDNSTDCSGGGNVDPNTATTGDTFARQAIQDDDPKVHVADANAEEGDDVAFAVTLSAPRDDKAITATLSTSDGSATAGADYTASEVTVTFPAGSTTPEDDEDQGVSGGNVMIPTEDDTAVEGNETFTLAVTEVDFGGAGSSGTGTIIDDDPGPEITADAGPDKTADSYAPVAFDGNFSGGTPPVSYVWDFGDGSPEKQGEKVTHRYTTEGTFKVVLTVTDDTGKTDTDDAQVTVTDSGDVVRSWGEDRILTAVDVSSDHWASSDDVLIATGYNFPDGLAAASLASDLDAPLLLTAKDQLPEAVADELERLQTKRVILLGGTNTISQAVEDDLEQRGYTVERVDGANRYETAGDIARTVGATAKGEVVLTLGESPDGVQVPWADALSAGSFAALDDVPPTLLTRRDSLPDETEQALADVSAKKVYVLGGPSAVSEAVEQELETLGYAVERLGGENRFHTSALVAAKALAMGGNGQSHPVFVTGFKFPDGLTGGALASRVVGPVLLVPGDDLGNAPQMRAFVEGRAQRFDVGTVVGGTLVISEQVRTQLEQAMEG